MQPMWLCILSEKPFEETFENTLCAPSEDSFDDTKWRKGALGRFIMKHANNEMQLMQIYPPLWAFTICRNKV